MKPVVLALPDNAALGAALADRLDAELGDLTVRRFPDGESYVRIATPVAGRAVILACTLDRPDAKLVPLAIVAATARDLGGARVGLVAPYLAYMRQDARFQPGEGVTSRYVARLLGASIDWLVTVDPHLHRHQTLDELYAIPALALHAAPTIAAWIRATVPNAVLIGPDRESAQWAGAVAAQAGVPCEILEKVRRGDRDVEVSVPGLGRWRGRTPVLVDDIISTAHTMIAAVRQLQRATGEAPVCVGVHAVFTERAYAELLAAGPARVVTCNTIRHPSNAIDVHPLVTEGVRAALAVAERRHA